MPTYSYKCNDCKENFECFCSISARDENKKCSLCGSLNTERTLDATTSRFNLKGDGWYDKRG